MTRGPAISVGWTGASGLIYGVRLVEVLLEAGRDVHLVVSDAAEQTAPTELDCTTAELIAGLEKKSSTSSLHVFGRREFTAGVASGSGLDGGMAICPCSLGTVGRIAAGTSETLRLRAADVCLKERRKLILVPRETPLATHQLENLARLSSWGAVILPAAPGFYHRPGSVSDLIDFIVQRICDHLDVSVTLIPRWGDPEHPGSRGA